MAAIDRERSQGLGLKKRHLHVATSRHHNALYYNPKGYSMLWSDIIDISWSDRKLEKSCASDKAGQRHFGAPNWKLMKRRLAALRAAPTLTDMEGVPGNCHALSADREGEFAVYLWGQYRLVFEPNHEPIPRFDDGGIDKSRVTGVVITEVVDYHGH
jgi:proteic killer suppression protein